jgi:hypothetical protein
VACGGCWRSALRFPPTLASGQRFACNLRDSRGQEESSRESRARRFAPGVCRGRVIRPSSRIRYRILHALLAFEMARGSELHRGPGAPPCNFPRRLRRGRAACEARGATGRGIGLNERSGHRRAVRAAGGGFSSRCSPAANSRLYSSLSGIPRRTGVPPRPRRERRGNYRSTGAAAQAKGEGCERRGKRDPGGDGDRLLCPRVGGAFGHERCGGGTERPVPISQAQPRRPCSPGAGAGGTAQATRPRRKRRGNCAMEGAALSLRLGARRQGTRRRCA